LTGLLLLWACGGDTSGAPGGGNTSCEAISAETVPIERTALFRYLSCGAYRSLAAESGAHPSAGPHGALVRVRLNAALDRSLADGNAEHPAGSAAIKEIFDEQSMPAGWSVMVKTEADSDRGRGWYWYETFSPADGRAVASGQGASVCTGCHSAGADFVQTAYPLR